MQRCNPEQEVFFDRYPRAARPLPEIEIMLLRWSFVFAYTGDQERRDAWT